MEVFHLFHVIFTNIILKSLSLLTFPEDLKISRIFSINANLMLWQDLHLFITNDSCDMTRLLQLPVFELIKLLECLLILLFEYLEIVFFRLNYGFGFGLTKLAYCIVILLLDCENCFIGAGLFLVT